MSHIQVKTEKNNTATKTSLTIVTMKATGICGSQHLYIFKINKRETPLTFHRKGINIMAPIKWPWGQSYLQETQWPCPSADSQAPPAPVLPWQVRGASLISSQRAPQPNMTPANKLRFLPSVLMARSLAKKTDKPLRFSNLKRKEGKQTTTKGQSLKQYFRSTDLYLVVLLTTKTFEAVF